MIRGRLWTALLERAADATRSSRFDPMHEVVRRLCLTGVLPCVDFAFRLELRPARAAVIARNSVLERRNFRVFESDLDVSLVFEDAASEESVERACRLYQRLHAGLPFLGELEIYDRREMRIKQKAAAVAGPIIDMIWLLRKWRWQYDRLSAAPSPYHRRKAEFSIRRIQNRLGLSGAALLPVLADQRSVGARVEELLRHLPRREPEAPIRARAGFLEWEITSRENVETVGSRFRMLCSGSGALALLSILPDGERVCPGESVNLAELRRSADVGETLLAVAAAEWTLIRSVERTHDDQRAEERRSWRRRLEDLFRAAPNSMLSQEFPEFAPAGRTAQE